MSTRHWMAVLLVGTLSAPAFAQSAFTENVTFRFAANTITYQGPINSAWLSHDIWRAAATLLRPPSTSSINHAELIGPW